MQCVNDEFARIEALKAFVFKDQAFTDDDKFDKCMSGGEYAELLDKKYYDYDGNSYTTKAEIENTPLYKQLAWCAISETLDREISYRQVKAFEEIWFDRFIDDSDRDDTIESQIHRVAETLLNKKWDIIAEKYPYTDYENAIKNPWYKDETKI